MSRSNSLSVLAAALPGLLGITGLALHYSGVGFAWIMAAAAVVCIIVFLALVFVMGRILGLFLLPAFLLAVISTIITSFFTGPWYIVLLYSLLAVYTLVFLTPLILGTVHKMRQQENTTPGTE
ncbi:MAG: hypothetical protein P8107_10945 [Spirochaetia bacterium]